MRRPTNRIFAILTVLCLVLSLAACSDDDAGGNNANNGNEPDATQDVQEDTTDGGSDAGPDASDGGSDADPDAQSDDQPDADPGPSSSLHLNIFDIDGAAIESASITLIQPDAQSADPSTGQSDAAGHASFSELAEGRTLAMVEADGFAPATAVVELPDATEATRTIHLLATGEPHPFDASQDSELYEDRVRLSIPANSLVDANGDDYTGAAQALITPLNPSTGERAGMPGPLEGVLEGDTDPTPMQSVFMADIQLETDTGEPLSIKDGSQATLEFVLPDDLQADFSVGDQIEAYWYDTQQGMWIQEGMGDVIESTYAAEKLAWTVDVSHFTWWNCDEPWYDKECVEVTVIDEATGNPVSGAQVYVDGISYNGTSYGTTGDTGITCVDFKLSSTAKVTASGPDGRTQIGDAVEISGTGTAATCGGQGEGDCQQVEIELAPPACLTGSIVDANGDPIDGATITAHYDASIGTESESVTSDASGEYCLSVPRGAEADVVVSYIDPNGDFMSASATATAADASQTCGGGSCTDIGPLTPEAGQMSCISGEVVTNPGAIGSGPAAPGTHVYVFQGHQTDAAGSPGDFTIDCTKPPAEWGTLLAETSTSADGTFCAPAPVSAGEVSVVVGKCIQNESCLRVRPGVQVTQPATCEDDNCTDLIEPIYLFDTCSEGP